MKKIGLFLNSEPYSGGVFQYNQAVVEALNLLPKNKFLVTIAYTHQRWEKYLEEYELNIKKIPYSFFSKVINKISTINNMCVIPKLNPISRALYEENCDLWIFPSQDYYSYRYGLPAVGTIHDLMHRYEKEFPEVSDNGQYEKREILYSNMCKYTKGILVDSEIGKKQVEESYDIDEKKIFVLPYIAPKYILSCKNKENIGFAQKYKLPSKYIFYPAQFWKHKNHCNLIKAIHLLRGRIPDISLVLVGSLKNGYEDAKKLVENLKLEDKVYFYGYVKEEDMVSFYKMARALVMPTFFGPTNIPQLEAFALGCPVATSNIYGIPEQVGDAAILFDPNSVDDIAKNIENLWYNDELCERLAEKGYKKTNQWGQKQFSGALCDIIEKILTS